MQATMLGRARGAMSRDGHGGGQSADWLGLVIWGYYLGVVYLRRQSTVI